MKTFDDWMNEDIGDGVIRRKSMSISRYHAVKEAWYEALKVARLFWIEENDPCDGTDIITPFDEYLYK